MIIYDEPTTTEQNTRIRITEEAAIQEQRQRYNRIWRPLIPFEFEDDKLLEDFILNNGAWRED